MEITSFNPLIATKDAESVIELFEELGFEKRHAKKGIHDGTFTAVRLRDANGFYVDVVELDSVPRDIVQIRVNVDDFDEAYDLLAEHGFRNVQGKKFSEDSTSKGTAMIAPSGYVVALVHHFKK